MWKPIPPTCVRIAERYANPTLMSYAVCKLATDPVYAAVAERIAATEFPLTDLGCGIGLCAFHLREHGYSAPILGVDIDGKKVAAAQQRAAKGYGGVEFRVQSGDDVSVLTPNGHGRGHVAMLDVLHYFEPTKQAELLARIADATAPGAWAILRATPRTQSWRFRMTVMEESFAQAIRWMKAPPQHFPSIDEVARPFRERGFREDIRPLWGRTPFNSYLFAFHRAD